MAQADTDGVADADPGQDEAGESAPGEDFDAVFGGEPFYTETQLATNGEGGWPNYRIPALTVTNSGDILASYDGRPTAADSPGPNSILQRRSTDNGATWGEQTLIREGDVEDPIEGYSDPSYIVDRETGTIFNFHVFSMDQGFLGSQPGTDPEDRNVIQANVATSTDEGETWTHRTITADITDDEAWRSRFAAAGQGIQLKYGPHAGRLIQQYTIINDDLDTFQAVSIYSDDHGQTWQAGEPVGAGMDENKTVELSDGRVMLNSRDSGNGGYRKVAISSDGGHSYDEVYIDEQLPDPTNNASIIRAFPNAPEGSPEAQILLFSNAGSTTGRVNGTIRMSCDDGQTWPVSRVFQPEGMAYSTLVTQPDGSIGLLYEPESGNGGIRYATFNLAWLGGICAGVSAEDASADPGGSATAEVTVMNQTTEDLTGVTVSLQTPSGWSVQDVTGPDVGPGQSAVLDVEVSVAEDAFPGSYRIPVTLTTDQGVNYGSFTFTVNAPDGEILTVVPELVGAPVDGEVVRGDQISIHYHVQNLSEESVAVVPSSSDLDGFDPDDGAPNCRFQALAPGAGYTCTTATRTVTEEDLAAGSFTPSTLWNVHQGGPDGEVIATVERDAPSVPLTPPANLVQQSQLAVADVSSEETTNEDSAASHAIDGDHETFWHTAWAEDTGPHHITLDLGQEHVVDALRYLPRQSGGTNGTLEDYELYVHDQVEDWGDAVAAGTQDSSRDTKVLALDESASGRYLTLLFLSSHSSGGHFASAAELNVQGTPAGEPRLTLSDSEASAGDRVTVSGSGFGASERLEVRLGSDPALLSRTTTDSDGAFTAVVRVGTSVAPGQHGIVATGLASGVTASAALTVVE